MSLQTRLEATITKHGVPGGCAALLQNGVVTSRAHAGITNVTTRTPVDEKTIFHIGSITKVFNATLLMQLVDEGLVSLEDPVQKHLPDFTLRDPLPAAAITVQMLLNHSSGIDCEMIPQADFDRDRIVDGYRTVLDSPSLFPPGEAVSYCNAASLVAGHLVQTLRERGWHELIRERLYAPLQMQRAAANVSEALLHRFAIGHLTDPATGAVKMADKAFLPNAMSPAGSTLSMTADDLLCFARLHLDGGVAPDGTRLLSEQAVQAMQAATISQSVGGLTMRYGLGWRLAGEGIVQHSGSGIGTAAHLIVHVPSRTAIVAMGNSDTALECLAQFCNDVLKEDAGLVLATDSTPAPVQTVSLEAGRYTGDYESLAMKYTVTGNDKGLSLSAIGRNGLEAVMHSGSTLPSVPLTALSEQAFKAQADDAERWGSLKLLLSIPVGFGGLDQAGRYQRLIAGGRVYQRTR